MGLIRAFNLRIGLSLSWGVKAGLFVYPCPIGLDNEPHVLGTCMDLMC